MATVSIFISAVSAEFRSYREALRHRLSRPNVDVKVQEDFIPTGRETLDKLDLYIRNCEAVVHLVGDMTGALAQEPSVEAIRQRYPDFGTRIPMLMSYLDLGAPALPYSQWEAWLALYHGKRLFVAVPKPDACRDPEFCRIDTQCARQREHLERLAAMERYPEIEFGNVDELALKVLASLVLETLAAEQGAMCPPSSPESGESEDAEWVSRARQQFHVGDIGPVYLYPYHSPRTQLVLLFLGWGRVSRSQIDSALDKVEAPRVQSALDEILGNTWAVKNADDSYSLTRTGMDEGRKQLSRR